MNTYLTSLVVCVFAMANFLTSSNRQLIDIVHLTSRDFAVSVFVCRFAVVFYNNSGEEDRPPLSTSPVPALPCAPGVCLRSPEPPTTRPAVPPRSAADVQELPGRDGTGVRRAQRRGASELR